MIKTIFFQSEKSKILVIKLLHLQFWKKKIADDKNDVFFLCVNGKRRYSRRWIFNWEKSAHKEFRK